MDQTYLLGGGYCVTFDNTTSAGPQGITYMLSNTQFVNCLKTIY